MDVNYYLSKGFTLEAANYFANGRRRIVNVTPQKDFTLRLLFDNGETRSLNVAALIQHNTVFVRLHDWNVFQNVYLDELGNVSWDISPEIDSDTNWNNKLDLCSDSCYLDSVPCKSLAEIGEK